MSADHRGWPGGASAPPPGPGGWPGATRPVPAGPGGWAAPGISAEAFLRSQGNRPARPVIHQAPPVRNVEPLAADTEDIYSAAELAELEEFDKEVDEDFEAEFGEDEDDEDLDEEEE